MEGSVEIAVALLDVQSLIFHWVMIESELLQFNSIRELMKRSWFRRYCSGDVNEDVPGIRVMEGGEQPGSDRPSVLCIHTMSGLLRLVMSAVGVVYAGAAVLIPDDAGRYFRISF